MKNTSDQRTYLRGAWFRSVSISLEKGGIKNISEMNIWYHNSCFVHRSFQDQIFEWHTHATSNRGQHAISNEPPDTRLPWTNSDQTSSRALFKHLNIMRHQTRRAIAPHVFLESRVRFPLTAVINRDELKVIAVISTANIHNRKILIWDEIQDPEPWSSTAKEVRQQSAHNNECMLPYYTHMDNNRMHSTIPPCMAFVKNDLWDSAPSFTRYQPWSRIRHRYIR